MLEVGQRLVAPRDVAARIAENLRTESSVGVRVRSLAVLAREFPRHPATRDALLASCQDPGEEVRLRAASYLGEEGRQTLLDLVERTGTGDSCAARAIAALGEQVPAARAESALRRALRYGEQWIFTYDRRTRTAMLRGGDAQWAARHVVLDGEVEGLVLGAEESAWLRACWEAAGP